MTLFSMRRHIYRFKFSIRLNAPLTSKAIENAVQYCIDNSWFSESYISLSELADEINKINKDCQKNFNTSCYFTEEQIDDMERAAGKLNIPISRLIRYAIHKYSEVITRAAKIE